MHDPRLMILRLRKNEEKERNDRRIRRDYEDFYLSECSDLGNDRSGQANPKELDERLTKDYGSDFRARLWCILGRVFGSSE